MHLGSTCLVYHQIIFCISEIYRVELQHSAKVKKGEFFEVTVEVGKLLKHPNEPGHFIQFIELYADDTYLARMDFTAKNTNPIMKTYVALEQNYSTLRAFERCNLHGTWENEINIEVKG